MFTNFNGNWVSLSPEFKKTMTSTLTGGLPVSQYTSASYLRKSLIQDIAKQGPHAFQRINGNGYSSLRASVGGVKVEIRTSLTNPGTGSSGQPVTVGGSIGFYLHGQTGEEEITARKIKAELTSAGEYAGAAALISDVLAKGLTRCFSTLAGSASESVDAAVAGAVQAGSEEVGASIGLELAIDTLAVVEFVGIVVAIAALIVTLFLGLLKTITFQLTVFNMSNYNLNYQINSFYNCAILHKTGNLLPRMNQVKDTLIPLGGGVTYDLASKVTLFFRNISSVDGLGLTLGVSGVGQELRGEAFTLLVNATSNGNSFAIDRGSRGSGWFNYMTGGGNPFQPKRTRSALNLSYSLPSYPGPPGSPGNRGLQVHLANDQLGGQTQYGGVTGYNYSSLLYIR